MVKAKELREQSPLELEAHIRELSKELFELRNEMKTTRKMEKPHLMRLKKKQRARALTVLTEHAMKTSG